MTTESHKRLLMAMAIVLEGKEGLDAALDGSTCT